MEPMPIAATQPQRRGWLKVGFQIISSAVLLALLIWRLPDVSFNDLGPSWTTSSLWLLVGSGTCMFIAYALSTLRWRSVIQAVAAPPTFRRLLSHQLAGQFVSNVLPTAFGGDVVRIARLRADLGDTSLAIASVTIERLTGWLVLPAISLSALAVARDLGSDHARNIAELIAIGTVVALGLVVVIAANRRWARPMEAVAGWRKPLVAIHFMVDALRGSPRLALQVLVSGLGFQITQCVAVWLAARAVGANEITLIASLAFFPAAAIAQNVPIGFGGLGIREAMFVLFFGSLGTSQSLAITTGLTVYLVTMVASCAGLPSVVMWRRTHHQPILGEQHMQTDQPHTHDAPA